MAGGKETPRQKMIGMMYLVLTALLALNVSSTVIEKFIFLNDSLERANREAIVRNQETLAQMTSSVDKKGNPPADVIILGIAGELEQEAIKVVAKLEEYKELFIEETDGYEEGFDVPNEFGHKGNRHHIKGKTNYDAVGHYMMPVAEGGQGHGDEVKKILGDYNEYIKNLLRKQEGDEELISHFKSMTPDAEDDPVYSEDPNQEGKKWSQLAFEYSPTHAGLATLSELQAEVISYHTRALAYLSTRTGRDEVVFDDVRAMVLPVSQRVVSGSTYEAEMFIAASSKSSKPTMTLDGRNIEVDESGTGKVSFSANMSGGTPEGNGVVKKSFKAAITVSTGAGPKVFENSIDYWVVQPALVISSNTAVSLYQDCANEIRVDVPGLSGNYSPSFSGSGARFIPGSGAGEVNIVPTSSTKVKMNVANAGQNLGVKEFSVNQVPPPNIVAKDTRGNELDPSRPIATSTRAININAVADPGFAKGHRKDARFVVARGEAQLLSGGLIRQKIPFSNGKLNLTSIASRVRKGDVLVIKIQSVVRRNFQNKNINVLRFPKVVTVTY